MKEEKRRHRIISYCLFGLFILSLVTIFLTSFQLVKNYRYHRQLEQLIDNMEKDYQNPSKDDNGYYIDFDEDENVEEEKGKPIIYW